MALTASIALAVASVTVEVASAQSRGTPLSTLARPGEAHPFRTALEELLFVGVGAAWYFSDDANQFDWDRPPFRDRFTHAGVRLDNNTLGINYLWHPLSGAAYYAFPRANGLNVPASFAYAAGASLLWEYGLEFREKISLNDVLTTPVTGLALGEFFSRLALYVNRAPGGGRPIHRAVGWLLGPSQAIHDAWDRLDPIDPRVPRDSLGYDASIAHRFEISYGIGLARGPLGASVVHEAAIEGRLVAIEKHLAPGRARGFFGDANATRLRLAIRQGYKVFGSTIDADTLMLGFRARSIAIDAAGSLRGFSLLAGSNVAFVFRRDSLPGYDDRLGTTRFPGLAIDVDAATPRARFFVSGRFNGELAGVTPLVFDAWHEQHLDVRGKTVLDRQGYYYALGYTFRFAARVETRFVTLRGGFDVSRFDSIEGWDRSQETVAFDVRAKDRVRDSELALRITPHPRLRAFGELVYHGRYRRSEVEELRRDVRITRGELRFGLTF